MEYKITAKNYVEEVTNSKIPVMIDFYADWCMPCKMMSPVTASIADAYEGKLKVCKVNVDEEPELARQFNVSSIPLFAFIKDGRTVDGFIGAVPQSVVESKIKALL
jgi:thioredoxin 1